MHETLLYQLLKSVLIYSNFLEFRLCFREHDRHGEAARHQIGVRGESRAQQPGQQTELEGRGLGVRRAQRRPAVPKGGGERARQGFAAHAAGDQERLRGARRERPDGLQGRRGRPAQRPYERLVLGSLPGRPRRLHPRGYRRSRFSLIAS